MKRLLYLVIAAAVLSSCGNTGNGELTGVPNRPKFYQPDPYGMTFIPLGSFTMGTGDQDVPYANVHQPKTISVAAFYMDETEITNNEYRQFVYWVRDSIAHTILGNAGPDFGEHFVSDRQGQPIQFGTANPYYKINWKEKIDWEGRKLQEGTQNPLEELYLPEEERFFRRKEIDTRKLFYRYFWVDLPKAARPENRYEYNRDQQGRITGEGVLILKTL